MIDRFERFSFAVFEISRCWHKIAGDVMAQYGLKGPYAIYLVVMRRFHDGITAARLCEMCSRDKADVSRAVTAMEKEGLICREGSGGYRASLKLTEAGREVANRVAELAERAVSRAGGSLEPDHLLKFYSALGVITANLQALSKEGFSEESQLKILLEKVLQTQ